MTGLCNCIGRGRNGRQTGRNRCTCQSTRNEFKQESGNYRTIALISHASKVLLRIIKRMLEEFLIPELPIEQARFRRGRGNVITKPTSVGWWRKSGNTRKTCTCASSTTRKPSIMSTMKDCGWYWGIWPDGSASTPDSVTEKAVHQPGSDSQHGVWRDRQYRQWERRETGMYRLTTAIQYLRRKQHERRFGRMGEWN